jgi:hypothetical protein
MGISQDIRTKLASIRKTGGAQAPRQPEVLLKEASHLLAAKVDELEKRLKALEKKL